HASTRDAAREKLAAALDETVALGIPTNKAFLAAVLRDGEFAAGKATTEFVSLFKFQAAAEQFAGDYGEWTSWSNNPAHRACGSERFFERHLRNNPLRSKAASDGRLVAPMNGRVVAVNVKRGEKVAAGKALVVLEAMKMEHGLNLPFAVQVNAIH